MNINENANLKTAIRVFKEIVSSILHVEKKHPDVLISLPEFIYVNGKKFLLRVEIKFEVEKQKNDDSSKVLPITT